MLFGPEKVLACPVCRTLVRTATLRSGNTFGAIRWSDGKLAAPMLPQMPQVHHCGTCLGYFWLEKATLLGEIELNAPEEAPMPWRQAPAARTLEADQYLAALAAGLAENLDEERELRILAWWAANDRYRAPDPHWYHPGEPDLAPGLEDNLRRLLDLLDRGDPEDRLMQAELARQLGDFAQAQALLAEPVDARYENAASRIRELASKGDRMVRLI